MIRRARLWLLYKVAVWVWREKKTFEEFAKHGHRKYAMRSNPGIYGIGELAPESPERWKLHERLQHFDEVQQAIAIESGKIEDELIATYNEHGDYT